MKKAKKKKVFGKRGVSTFEPTNIFITAGLILIVLATAIILGGNYLKDLGVVLPAGSALTFFMSIGLIFLLVGGIAIRFYMKQPLDFSTVILGVLVLIAIYVVVKVLPKIAAFKPVFGSAMSVFGLGGG